MEEIQAQQETERPVMASNMAGFSGVDERAIDAWRRRGRTESRIIFFFMLGTFILGMTALIVLYTRTAPSPEAADVSANQAVYQASIAQQAEPEIAWLASQLKLGEDQVGKIKPVVNEEQRKINQVLADSSLSSEVRIAKVNQIRLDTLRSFGPMLTNAQSIRLKQLRDQEETELRAVWDQASDSEKQGN